MTLTNSLKSLLGERYRTSIILFSALAILFILVGSFLIYRTLSVRTYYIVYVGKYQNRAQIDRLSEAAIRDYLAALNAKVSAVKFELKVFKLSDHQDKSSDHQDMKEIYAEFASKEDTILVLDNTWGGDLGSVPDLITQNNIPVISLNANKAGGNFGKNVVFLGADDRTAEKIVNFSTQILKSKHLIFITEKNYPLKENFDTNLDKVQVNVPKIEIDSDTVNDDEKSIIFAKLDAALNTPENSDVDDKNNHNYPAIVMNSHWAWGNEILKHIEEKYTNVKVVGASSIFSSSSYRIQESLEEEKNPRRFDQDSKGNSLILFTRPSDAVPDEINRELQKIRLEHPDIPDSVNDKLFIQRCRHAISLLEKVIYKEPQKKDGAGNNLTNNRLNIARSDFTDFFANRLSGKETLVHSNRLLKFDDDLLMDDERTFEIFTRNNSFSYPKQFDSKGRVIQNVNFGFRLGNITKIDTIGRTFHADFFYRLRYAKENEGNTNPPQHIVFLNETTPSPTSQEIASEEIPEFGMVSRLYKKSGDFSMDADFTKYPFDEQALKIEIESYNLTDGPQVSLDRDSIDKNKNTRDINVDEWNLKSSDISSSTENVVLTSFLGNPIDTNKPQNSKNLSIRMKISRAFPGTALILMLPLFIIGIITLCLLFIKDVTFQNVGGMTIVTFLSLVTYSAAFAQNTPKTDRVTPASIFFYLTFAIVLGVFIRMLLVINTRRWSGVRAFCLTNSKILIWSLIGFYMLVPVVLAIICTII